jgi:hypothetical protein
MTGSRQIFQQGRATVDARESGGEKIPVQVRADVTSGDVIADPREPVVLEPFRMQTDGAT